MKKVFCIIILGGIVSSCLFQDRNSDIEYVGRILKNEDVRMIVFDSEGRAWIKSFEHGLSRVDTNGTVERFEYEDYFSQQYDVFKSLQVDSNDRLWFVNHGLISFDGNTFTRHQLPDSIKYINEMLIDEDDIKWILAIDADTIDYYDTTLNYYSTLYDRHYSLVKYDMEICEVLEIEDSLYGDYALRSMVLDHDNNIWFLCNDQLMKFDGMSWVTYDLNDFGIEAESISHISVDQNNRICGVNNYYLGGIPRDMSVSIFIFDGNSSTILYQESWGYRRILVDSENNYWISSYKDISLYDGVSFNNTSLRSPGFCMSESSSGEIWVGTDEGIDIYKKK